MEKTTPPFLSRISGWARRQGHSGNGRVSPRVQVIALVVNEQDRQVLAGQKAFEAHFAQSYEDAWDLMKRLSASVVLLDQDWPGTDWRAMVQLLASSSQRPCVILLCGRADEFLWEWVIRHSGYDVLAKPLQADDVEIVVKVALAYRELAMRSAV
jgi:DNA-binding NtrC family response regulator